MWGTEREQPRPSPTRRCAWQNTCANATVERVGVGLITGTAEILVCKTENQDRRLDLIEPSVCLLLGDLPTRGQRVHTMECVFCACLDAQVHPIQGAALELSVPFQRAGEPGCPGSTAIRMALLKTEDGAVAGRFRLYVPFKIQGRPKAANLPSSRVHGFRGLSLVTRDNSSPLN